MTTLRFYGGVGEIGGNQILLQTDKTRVFLDFGKSFALEGSYFDFPLMRPFYIPDLINIRALPPIDGLYRGTGPEPAIDGILLSHPHVDHYGYISMLNQGTRIYLGVPTLELIRIRDETYHRYWDRELGHLNFETFWTGEELSVGDITFRPVHVDHSIPAAYAYLIHAGGKTLAYTGDLRMHGYQRDFTRDFLAELERERVDVLICEGTNLAPPEGGEDAFLRRMEAEFLRRMGKAAPRRERKECETEGEVRERLAGLISGMRGLVLAETNPADVDRIRTLWRVAGETGRELVLDARQAYIVYQLGKRTRVPDLPGAGDSRVLLGRRKLRGAEREDEETYQKWREDWEMILIAECESVGRPPLWGLAGRKFIREHACELLLCTSNAAARLAELKYDQPPFEVDFVLSKSEPFTEELVLSFDKLLHWLALFGIREYHQVHVSGHCDAADLRGVVERADPAMLFPVHTEHPELFKGLVGGAVEDIRIPERGREYSV